MGLTLRPAKRGSGQAGFSLEFKKDSSGAVAELVFYQPNGTFVAKRK